MPARDGDKYLATLRTRDKPEIWIGAEQVEDVTTHPAIKPAVTQMAQLYDLQHETARRDYMLSSGADGNSYGNSLLIPQSQDDLLKRRKMHQAWAEHTYGMMGRSTDFMNAMLTAWYISADYFGPYADNVRSYYEYVRDNDIFLTHVLINPQVDRSKPPSEQPDPFTYLGVVRETDEGLIVRGAKMLATAGAYADEMLVWPFGRFSPKDAPYAISFAIPMNAPGVRQIVREPYAKPNVFDHPLSSRYDELDSIIVFDDVLVPWNRVFMNQDPERVNNLGRGVNSNAFTGHQTSVRLLAKLQFIAGLAMLGAESIQTSSFPNVQDMIGEITTYIELTKAAIIASEADPVILDNGIYTPNVVPLLAIRNSGNRWYPRVRELMQLLLAGGLMYQPASAEIFSSPIAADIEKYYRGAEMNAKDKIKLFKAASDVAVSAFGARHELYERFYSGDPMFLRVMTQYQAYDKSEAMGMAQRFLDGYDL